MATELEKGRASFQNRITVKKLIKRQGELRARSISILLKKLRNFIDFKWNEENSYSLGETIITY